MLSTDFVLLFSDSTPDGVLIRINAYRLWLRRCSKDEFETHTVVYVAKEMVSDLQGVLK